MKPAFRLTVEEKPLHDQQGNGIAKLYNWLLTELQRNTDRVVFWVFVAMMAIGIAHGWIR